MKFTKLLSLLAIFTLTGCEIFSKTISYEKFHEKAEAAPAHSYTKATLKIDSVDADSKTTTGTYHYTYTESTWVADEPEGNSYSSTVGVEAKTLPDIDRSESVKKLNEDNPKAKFKQTLVYRADSNGFMAMSKVTGTGKGNMAGTEVTISKYLDYQEVKFNKYGLLTYLEAESVMKLSASGSTLDYSEKTKVTVSYS